MKIISRLRRESGQSTTELALMMPIIFAMFFWAMQVNIIMSGYHQIAYASFMGARSFEVEHGDDGHPQHVMSMILTGRIYTETGPSIEPSQRKDVKPWSGKTPQSDGVTLTMPGFASLPYVRGLLDFQSSVPTHLGPDEWDPQIWDDSKRDTEQSGKPCEVTDNNVRDQHC